MRNHTKKWFIDRIGKTIHRKKLPCTCWMCQNTTVYIRDKAHAIYLFDCQNDMDIKYQDTPIKDGHEKSTARV